MCVIDCRGMLQGWMLWPFQAPGIQVAVLHDILETFMPAHWCLHIEGAALVHGVYRCQDGQLLHSSFVPEPTARAAEYTPSEGGDSESHTLDQSIDDMSDDEEPNLRPDRAHRRSSRSRSPRRNQGEPVDSVGLHSRISNAQRPRPKSITAPPITGCLGWLFTLTFFQTIGAGNSMTTRACSGRPLAPPCPSLPPRDKVDSTVRTHGGFMHRPVPTPCRERQRSSKILLASWDPKPTLLEEAVHSMGSLAFFEARVVVEVLYEHFGIVPDPLQVELSGPDFSAMVPARMPLVTAEPCTLVLEALIPKPDPSLRSTPNVVSRPIQLLAPDVPEMCTFSLGLHAEAPSFQEPLHLGSTPLGFAYVDILALFQAGASLLPMAEIRAICAALFDQPQDIAGELYASLQKDCAPGDLFCYTDGSFTERTAATSALCGWACVFLDPHAKKIGAIHGSYPAFLCATTDQQSPFLAEVSGLLAAALPATAVFQTRIVHFRSDCVSALAIAEGKCDFHINGLSQSMRHAFALRQATANLRDTFVYVPGHSGLWGNEIADALSKAGARFGTPSCGLNAARNCLYFWLSDGGPRLPWAATAIQIGRGDQTLPPLNGEDLGHDGHHQGLTATQFLEPFLPPGLGSPPIPSDQGSIDSANPSLCRNSPSICHVRFLSLNVLSLGAALETDSGAANCEEGLAYRPGKAQLVAAQLKQHGVHVACFQETRCEAGKIRSGGFIRFCSGAVRGQWGVEWWILENHPFFVSTVTGQSTLVSFTESMFTVVLREPRRLFVRCVCPNLRMLMVGLHAPHRATEAELIDQWWADTHLAIRTHSRGDLLVLAGDMNAAVGSNPSESVGPLWAEVEDEPGAALHAILREFSLFLPATRDGMHEGPSHTYCQKRGKKLCRPDLIAIPLSWAFSECHSYLIPELHAGQCCQDHTATATDVTLHFSSTTASRPVGRRNIRARDILDPSRADQIEQALRDVPAVPWSCSAHAHAAILASHVQGFFNKLKRDAPTVPHRTYLQEDTWQLQRQVATIRRSLHRLQHRCHQQFLAASFLAWARSRTTYASDRSNAWLK